MHKYTPSKWLESFYIAGYQFRDGVDVLELLRLGDELDLVPEFDNPYDPEAIAIMYKGTHMGYVPRSSNSLPAKLIYFGNTDVIKCKVVALAKEGKPFEQVKVGIYVADKRTKKGR